MWNEYESNFLSPWDKIILACKTTLLKIKESIVGFLVLCTDELSIKKWIKYLCISLWQVDVLANFYLVWSSRQNIIYFYWILGSNLSHFLSNLMRWFLLLLCLCISKHGCNIPCYLLYHKVNLKYVTHKLLQ